MRGRMPFPDPLFAITILILIASLIIPGCLKIFRSTPSQSKKEKPSSEKRESTQAKEAFAPSADLPMSGSSDPGPIQVEVQVFEVGSGTKELSFDWISSPFGINENTRSPEDAK